MINKYKNERSQLTIGISDRINDPKAQKLYYENALQEMPKGTRIDVNHALEKSKKIIYYLIRSNALI